MGANTRWIVTVVKEYTEEVEVSAVTRRDAEFMARQGDPFVVRVADVRLADDAPAGDDGSIADSIGYSPVSGGTFG